MQLKLKSQQRLRSERKNFWAAVHNAADGLAILDDTGAIIFANEAFYKFISLVTKNSKTSNPLNLIKAIEKQDRNLASSLASQISVSNPERIWNSELELKEQKENTTISIYYSLSLSTARFDNDDDDFQINKLANYSNSSFVLWAKDITAIKEKEKKERDLLSTTSHDLKGPLSAILTSAEMLADLKNLDEKQSATLVTQISSCARNCISIIDELLSARRIQDGVLIIKPKFYSVNEILEEIYLDYFPTVKAKSINFVFNQAYPDFKIYADKLALLRVLGNLVSNAVKFTPYSGQVALSARQSSTETELIVSDNGSGIDPQTSHILFERWGKANDNQDIPGTGLGLYVSKNIISAHGGKIEFNSTLGVGTTFIVSLPKKN